MIEVDLKNPEFIGPFSPHPAWKAAFIKDCQRESGIRTLIETGTYMGGMLSVCYKHFDYLASVELSPHFYIMCEQKFKHAEKIHLEYGSSRDRIAGMIMSAPRGPILFWLDAHTSGGRTADGGEQLSYEIAAINVHRPESLVLIDDIVPCEGGYSGPWGKLNLEGWHTVFVHGVLVLRKRQQDYGWLSKW